MNTLACPTGFAAATRLTPASHPEPAGRHVSQFEMECAMSEKLIESLRETTAALRQKLIGVLRPSAPTGDTSKAQPEPFRVPIADAVYRHNSALSEINANLQELLEHIDL